MRQLQHVVGAVRSGHRVGAGVDVLLGPPERLDGTRHPRPGGFAFPQSGEGGVDDVGHHPGEVVGEDAGRDVVLGVQLVDLIDVPVEHGVVGGVAGGGDANEPSGAQLEGAGEGVGSVALVEPSGGVVEQHDGLPGRHPVVEPFRTSAGVEVERVGGDVAPRRHNAAVHVRPVHGGAVHGVSLRRAERELYGELHSTVSPQRHRLLDPVDAVVAGDRVGRVPAGAAVVATVGVGDGSEVAPPRLQALHDPVLRDDEP